MRAGALLRLCSNPGLHYQQGQRPGPGIREYFYYVDHQGQLFLDDTKVKNFVTCFKDVRFLSFFFRHLERNRVGRYQRRFPWVSRCGRERNFLRCSDLPVVFTQLLRGSRGSSLLSYCGGGAELAVPFQPGMLAVLPESGKDVRFLSFFFRHLERNRVGRYQRRFPWVSRCGRERNFLRCSDLPVVFTQLLRGSRGSSLLSYCGGGAELAVPFQPGMLAVLPKSGKDVRFLSFFFRHLERNRVGRYQRRFPWVSRCGRERNFLRCSDLPVVFTQLLRGSRGSSLLSYCGGGAELAVPFQPGMLAVLPENGRLYHPAPERVGAVGLVRSALAQELSAGFRFRHGPEMPPTHFCWEGKEHRLAGDILGILRAQKAGAEGEEAISTS